MPGVATSAHGVKSYLESKAKLLSLTERLIIIQMDEIYVKPGLTYKKGNNVGYAQVSLDLVKTTQVFLMSGIRQVSTMWTLYSL